MRHIEKAAEPGSLRRHRATSHSDYDNYRDKDGLRAALVVEQRGLCCYCMGRILPEHKKMKIEHWRCVAKYPERQLYYSNLLGACLGGEGKGARFEHCDTKKADRDLLWNPADRRHRIETRIEYGADGSIRSADMRFNEQLNNDLNLNLAAIKNGRKHALDGIGPWWEKARTHDATVLRRRLESKISQLADVTFMAPYVPVAIWWLRKRLDRMRV